MDERDKLRYMIIGLIAKTHGFELSLSRPLKVVPVNLDIDNVKITVECADQIMKEVDEYVKNELQQQFWNDNP